LSWIVLVILFIYPLHGVQSEAEVLQVGPVPNETPGPEPSSEVPSIDEIASCIVENRGQMDNTEILFYAVTPAGGIAFLRSEIWLTVDGCCIQIKFAGAKDVAPAGEGILGSHRNYLVGNSSLKWHLGIDSFTSVIYEGLYEGIDLLYHLNNGILKYEFIVGQHSDPNQIRFNIQGHDDLRLADDEGVIIETPNRKFMDTSLEVFYEDAPSERIGAEFIIHSYDCYGFQLGPYDPSRVLVIDPILFSSYIGGGSFDYCYGIESEADRFIYLTGDTSSPDFPTTPGAFNRTHHGIGDVFVSKIDGKNGSLVYSTLIGGSQDDYGTAITVDEEGCAYITGRTLSEEFPVTEGAIQTEKNLFCDAFVCKLDPNGTSLEFSTFLGGEKLDDGEAIVLDYEGNVVIGGTTLSRDFQTTPDAMQPSHGGMSDAFLSILSPNGTSMLYSTFIGNTSVEYGNDIAVDTFGRLCIVGETQSVDFPVTPDAYTPYGRGGYDVFVTMFERNLTSFNFSSRLGGRSDDFANGVTICDNGTVVVCGKTSSDAFPISGKAFQMGYRGGDSEGFVLQLSINGSSLLYSTYVGGGSADICSDVEAGEPGSVLVTGSTDSYRFPITNNAVDKVKGEDYDAFLLEIDLTSGALTYSTFLGGNKKDEGNCLSVSHGVLVYVAGSTSSNYFPLLKGSVQSEYLGYTDGFFIGINIDFEAPVAIAGDNVVVPSDEALELDGTRSTDNHVIVNWTWSLVIGEWVGLLYGPSILFTFHRVGYYDITLTVRDPAGNEDSDTFTVVVPDAGLDITTTVDERAFLQSTEVMAPIFNINWSWTFPYRGKERTLYGVMPIYRFEYPGIYLVDLNVTDRSGNFVTDQVVITVLSKAGSVADAGDDLTVDQHQPVTFDGTRCSTGIESWTWTFLYNGSWNTLTGPTPQFTFATVGTFEVKLRIRDFRGYLHTDWFNITVRDVTPPVAIAGEDLTIDQHVEVELDASESHDNVGITRYTFLFEYQSESLELAGPWATFTFDEAGNYTIYLFLTDGAGNGATDTITIIVRDVTSPRASAGPDVTIDQSENVVFDGMKSKDNVGVIFWTWTFTYQDQLILLEGTYPSFLFEVAGSYNVTLTVSDLAGNQANDTTIVTVRDITRPTAMAGQDLTINAGEKAILYGRGSYDNIGISNWTWTFNYKKQVITLYGEVQSYLFEVPGDYNVTLTVFDEVGNNASHTIRVHVFPVKDEDGSDWSIPIISMAIAIVVVLAAWIILKSRKVTARSPKERAQQIPKKPSRGR
jgi:hypothetical protein